MQREGIFAFPLQQWLRERAKSLRRRLRFKCDGTRTETRFRLSAKRTSPFKSAGASVQSTTGSRGVRISGSNAGYTMFRGSVKVVATHSIRQFPLHFPSHSSLCDITFQLDSTYIARLFSKCSLHTAPISSHLFANRSNIW